MNIFCKITNDKPIKSQNEKIDTKEDTPNSISDRDLRRLYSVEFKSQSYASYYTTSMEKDKSILTLSVAGVGFSLTLLKLAEVVQFHDLIVFIFSSLFYLGSIYSVVTMFGKNADFMIDLTQDKDVSVKQYELKRLDKTAIRCFYAGIVLTIVLGLSTSIGLIGKENNMSNKDKSETTSQSEYSRSQVGLESLEKAVEIRKSFASATGLKPTENSSSSSTSSSGESGAAAMKPDVD